VKNVFLLGVGCHKGGTSWLHDYLAHHPNANMGFLKEYHIFDALFVPECRVFLDKVRKSSLDALREGSTPSEDHQVLFKLLGFYTDPESYFDYFWVLANRDCDTRLTGDLTPSYAALPARAFAKIKEGLERRNFEVKVIFLMRDPVERCISTVRMISRDAGVTLTSAQEAEALRRAYATRPYEIRTRYEVTIRELEAVFRADDIYFAFFERLFAEESIRQITTFLSLPYVAPNFERQINVSRNTNETDPELRKEIFDFYRDTYEFVASRFGRNEIRAMWANYDAFSSV
jgi:Sulfotransferase family